MKNALKILAAVFVLAGTQSALAAPLEFTANLSGPNESPANASPGIGLADVFYDPNFHTLQVHVSFSGLLGTTTASHIHCCTAAPFVSTSGIATVTPNFTGFPLGVTSGTYDSPVFDLTTMAGFNGAFITANGGTPASAEAALLAGLMGNKSYLNIHSTVVPGGEIRGFLVFVPEPVTLSLFGAGLVGAAAMRRRKKKIA
ncbi:MAG: CHRD domain-containing protein [Alphaproteobacteria bacterium]|nr:CHRD domain-containing protein [Alphaproteobacteria bacterium]